MKLRKLEQRPEVRVSGVALPRPLATGLAFVEVLDDRTRPKGPTWSERFAALPGQIWDAVCGVCWGARGNRLGPAVLVAALVHVGLALTVGLQPPAQIEHRSALVVTLVQPERAAPQRAAVTVAAEGIGHEVSAPPPNADAAASTKPAGAGGMPAKIVKPESRKQASMGSKGRALPLAHAPRNIGHVKSTQRSRPQVITAQPERGGAGHDGAWQMSSGSSKGSSHPGRIDASLLAQQIHDVAAGYANGDGDGGAHVGSRVAWISAVKDHRSAALRYLRGWQAQVERTGERNYPAGEEAAGRLRLTVEVKADGSLKSVRVQTSSGDPELDRAAVHIVQLAAPFAPFPEELKERYDVLKISPNWTFRIEDGATRAP